MLHCMKTRPLKSGAKCYATELVQWNSVCLSTVLPARSSTSQSSIRSNTKNAFDNPSMAHPTMVSSIAENIDKQPLLLFKEEKLLFRQTIFISRGEHPENKVQKNFGNSNLFNLFGIIFSNRL